MKTIDSGSQVRIVWIIAVGVLLVGYYCVDFRYQRAIGLIGQQTQVLFEKTAANERIVSQAVRLRLEQQRVDTDMARLSKDQSEAAVTAAFLTSLQRIGNRSHTQILAVEPARSNSSLAAAGSIAHDSLVGIPVSIRANGQFGDLLRFVEGLSHLGILLAVSDTQLSVSAGIGTRAQTPALDATIHATLYRIKPRSASLGGPRNANTP